MLFLCSKLANTFNGIRQSLWVLLVIFVTMFPLSTLSMDKKTEETEEKPQISITPPLANTFTMLAGAIEAIQTVLSPPLDAHTPVTTSTPSPLAYQQARTLITDRSSNPLFARAKEFVEGTSSNYPDLKTTDSHTMLETMVLAGMQVRPQHFGQLEVTEGSVLPDIGYAIAHKFLQEFTQSGALDSWVSHFQQKIQSKEPNDSNQAMMEFLNSGVGLLKLMGSDAVNDPTKDPLNKYVDPEDIKEAIKLEEWLEQNPKHEKYNTIHIRFMELDEGIRAKREQALKQGGKYMFSLLKRMKPDLANMEEMSEVISHHKNAWSVKKREKFEVYVLEEYGKQNLLEDNFLRSFWEVLERNQYGQVCYKIVCESFQNQHKNNPLHQIVQQIWFASQLDTMNEHPKEARSRMPRASFNGTHAPNFGYAMGESEAYQKWAANPLARASGDIIIDAYHSVVDFGLALDIEVFLERLSKHLCNRKDFLSNPHEYDRFMRPFKLYLLEKEFHTSFISGSGRTISGELMKAAESNENLYAKARAALKALIKFSRNMFALRPSKDKSQKGGRSEGLVFGIGFNGLLFDSPYHSQKEDNEICLAFSSSGQKKGGYLLLSLINDVAKSQPRLSSLPSSLFDNFGNSFNRYKPLIHHHVLKETENAHYISGPYWDAHLRAYIEQKQVKFKGFLSQLESGQPYESLTPEFQEWVRDASNWYYLPHEVNIQIPSKMPIEEHPAQCAARNLLFDALAGISFSRYYKNLMPHLFLHWKEEILQKTDTQKHFVIKEAKNLGILPEGLQREIFSILDDLVKQVHPELKSAWCPIILGKFQKFMSMGEKRATIDPIANLSIQEYENFRKEFFKDCKVSQCVEPVFSRVLGHDRFFPVYLSKKPAKAPIRIDNTNSRLQLGNRILQDVIAPCDNRCQYHALGHLYTGDMLSYQSADRLDYKRRTHGLGNVPDQFMSFGDIQQYFPSVSEVTGEENNEQDSKTRELIIKKQLLSFSSDQEIRKKIAPEIIKRLKDGTAPQALQEDPKCQKILRLFTPQMTLLRKQRFDSELDKYAQSKLTYQKYLNALATLNGLNTEGVLAVLTFLREKDIPKSEEDVKQESRKLAIADGKIGPREIEGWELEDVDDEGNCFYDAVAHQMKITGHSFLMTVPKSTLARDSLRLLAQEEQFNDLEWAKDRQIDELVKKLDVILAFVSTKNPEQGYVYYYLGDNGKVETHIPGTDTVLPTNKPIFKLAATGNHFLSVKSEKK
jgi:hypothetical protein